MNYLPTEAVTERLNFRENGSEPEHWIDYLLEIAGYELNDTDKAFMEMHSIAIFDFKLYNYCLWPQYLQPKFSLE